MDMLCLWRRKSKTNRSKTRCGAVLNHTGLGISAYSTVTLVFPRIQSNSAFYKSTTPISKETVKTERQLSVLRDSVTPLLVLVFSSQAPLLSVYTGAQEAVRRSHVPGASPLLVDLGSGAVFGGDFGKLSRLTGVLLLLTCQETEHLTLTLN